MGGTLGRERPFHAAFPSVLHSPPHQIPPQAGTSASHLLHAAGGVERAGRVAMSAHPRADGWHTRSRAFITYVR